MAWEIGEVGIPDAAAGSGVSEVIASALEASFPATFSRPGGKASIEAIAAGIVDGVSGGLFGWDDLRVPMNNLRPGPTPPPFSELRNGLFLWAFPSGGGPTDYLYFAAQLPHSYAPGTDIEPHVHWTCGANHAAEAAAASTVRWVLRLSAAWMLGTGGVEEFPAAADYPCEGKVTGADYTHQVTGAVPDLSGVDLGESTIILGRIERDNTVAGNAASPVFLLEVDFHFRTEKIGTLNSSPPFGGP